MTPTEQDIEFFREAQRIQELWEPKCLDFVYSPKDDEVFSLAQALIGWGPMPSKWIFIPRQGQLQAMLEERGYKWEGGTRINDPGYMMTAWYMYEGGKTKLVTRLGPTPSIALGKCLLEILGSLKNED